MPPGVRWQFAARGYEQTSVAGICAEAGVSKGAFYHHFQSKQELFNLLLQDWLSGIRQEMNDLLADNSDMQQGLARQRGLGIAEQLTRGGRGRCICRQRRQGDRLRRGMRAAKRRRRLGMEGGVAAAPQLFRGPHRRRGGADLLQSLLDLIEDGAGALPLEETDAVTGEEAVSDGNAILEDIYGSRNDALVALRAAATDVPERELAKLAPISATVVVAALAQSNAPMALTGVQPVGDQGILGTIIGGVLNGVVQGVVRELKSSKGWRSATGYTKSRAKRKTSSASRKKTTKSRTTRSSSSKRRTTSASIEDIFRDILGNIGK